MFGLLNIAGFEQVIAIRDIIRPPTSEDFNDVYIVYELMDTDLHQIIRSNQPLTEDHCQVQINLQIFCCWMYVIFLYSRHVSKLLHHAPILAASFL